MPRGRPKGIKSKSTIVKASVVRQMFHNANKRVMHGFIDELEDVVRREVARVIDLQKPTIKNGDNNIEKFKLEEGEIKIRTSFGILGSGSLRRVLKNKRGGETLQQSFKRQGEKYYES